MAGRHALLTNRGVNNTTTARGLAVAGAFGMIAGVGLPTAVAAPEAQDKQEALKAVPNTVELTAEAETAVAGTTVEISSNSGGEWEMATIEVEAEEPVVVEEPEAPAATEQAAAQTQTASAQTQAAPAQTQAAPAQTQQAAAQTQQAAPAQTQQAPAPAPARSGSSSAVLNTAMAYVGAPYVWGGTTPAGWDCIGFVRYVYAQHGVSIGGYTTSVLSAGRQVPYSQAQPGDILYWPGHVAIYAGNGQNVGAWNPSMGTTTGSNSYLGTPVVIRVFG